MIREVVQAGLRPGTRFRKRGRRCRPPSPPYQDDAQSPNTGPVDPNKITTGGATYDPTILTKFIPGTAFVARQGDGIENDRTDHIFSGSCVYPATGSGGLLTEYRTGVELPDGARIKRVVFFGEDDDAVRNIVIRLNRTSITPPLFQPAAAIRADATIASFTTSGFTGVVVVSSPDLTELVGSVPGASVLIPGQHRFHTLEVEASNAAGFLHKLCGVEVEYQVPISSANVGTVFRPVDPARAFDSRIPAYPGSGILAKNASKVISIKDGHNAAGTVTVPDVVPPGATAVAYNVTIAGQTGPNFLAVTAGDAAGFTASAVNFNGTADVANAGIVSIDAQRRIKVWGGSQAGSMHVIIDITGYYAPLDLPNMGN